jgi:peptidoglycan/LPS O-acetylase OafA/YrhL
MSIAPPPPRTSNVGRPGTAPRLSRQLPPPLPPRTPPARAGGQPPAWTPEGAAEPVALTGGKERFAFLDGLRAFAAAQVVMIHYLYAFLPVLVGAAGVQAGLEGSITHNPLFFPVDGYFAVDIFFLISGFVLAPSFIKSAYGFTANAVKRALRLGLPVLGAVVFATLLLAALPVARGQAATLSKSPWLASLYTGPISLVFALKNAIGTLLTGNGGISVFSEIPRLTRILKPQPIGASFDPPLWTIHWELWGSLLLIGMAQIYRRVPETLFWIIFGVVVALCGTSYLTMFLIGFALYTSRQAFLRHRSAEVSSVGAVMIAGGALFAVFTPGAVGLQHLIQQLPGLRAFDVYEFQQSVGAVMAFAGLMLCAPLRNLLGSRPLTWLGRLSFSFYLFHFPVMVTIGALVFVAARSMGPGNAALLAILAGVGSTLVSAWIFEVLVDRPSVSFSGKAGAAVNSVLDLATGPAPRPAARPAAPARPAPPVTAYALSPMSRGMVAPPVPQTQAQASSGPPEGPVRWTGSGLGGPASRF